MAYKLKDIVELTEIFPELLNKEVSGTLQEELDRILKFTEQPKSIGQKWAEQSYPRVFGLPEIEWTEKRQLDFFSSEIFNKKHTNKS